MSIDSQFQLTARYPGNLDRCRRCGYPRLQHGVNGTCGLSFSVRGRVVALSVIVGMMLAAVAGATWLLASSTDITAGSLIAFACLLSLILLASGSAILGRRR